ncbi:hypothetical protein S245_024707, partial [Arachis hypogaea]
GCCNSKSQRWDFSPNEIGLKSLGSSISFCSCNGWIVLVHAFYIVISTCSTYLYTKDIERLIEVGDNLVLAIFIYTYFYNTTRFCSVVFSLKVVTA